jgi:hypothetical protein
MSVRRSRHSSLSIKTAPVSSATRPRSSTAPAARSSSSGSLCRNRATSPFSSARNTPCCTPCARLSRVESAAAAREVKIDLQRVE